LAASFINRTYGLAGAKGGKMNLRHAASHYIFSGLLKCGVCGAKFMIVSGTGRHHDGADYGVPITLGEERAPTHGA